MTTTEQTAEPLRGPELLRQAVNHILAHPETWDQRSWHCGTTHCIAGHCQILGGSPASENTVMNEAREFLGISMSDANWLFSGSRTLPEIYLYTKLLLDPSLDSAGYNRDGYNCAGYNCDGYNRAGYNRDGYNCAGYNRDGYNRDGYNCDGYNRAGYNRDGYNCAGYNCDGYNRAGYNRAGSKLELIPL